MGSGVETDNSTISQGLIIAICPPGHSTGPGPTAAKFGRTGTCGQHANLTVSQSSYSINSGWLSTL